MKQLQFLAAFFEKYKNAGIIYDRKNELNCFNSKNFAHKKLLNLRAGC